MALEVEQKYRVASHKSVLAVLDGWDANVADPVRQTDCYYNHPQRDFAQTDEALRIRSIGDANWVTYKGPKLDQTTKTRVERELAIASGQASYDSCAAILESLGFAAVATVTKRRSTCHIQRSGFAVEIALDDVEHLGHFVELEASLGEADDKLDQARQVLAGVAAELGLSEVERKSYLELLLT